jgi:hypothetical protein
MSTLTQLITAISRDLRDVGNNTFTTAMVTDLINSGITELSRIAPKLFQEDIEPDGSLSYEIQDGEPRCRIERVEVWAVDPDTVQQLIRIPAASEGLSNETEAGWRFWNGSVELPYAYAAYLADDTKNLRIWGWGPYAQLDDGSDASDLGVGGEAALKEYCLYMAYDRLASERALFRQYQVQANNTDVTFAGLMGAINQYRSRWERRRDQLMMSRLGGF